MGFIEACTFTFGQLLNLMLSTPLHTSSKGDGWTFGKFGKPKNRAKYIKGATKIDKKNIQTTSHEFWLVKHKILIFWEENFIIRNHGRQVFQPTPRTAPQLPWHRGISIHFGFFIKALVLSCLEVVMSRVREGLSISLGYRYCKWDFFRTNIALILGIQMESASCFDASVGNHLTLSKVIYVPLA